MRITVHNLHDDTQKVFEGDPASIVQQLVAAHPWLNSPDPADQDFEDVLEHLESSSGYAVNRPSDVDCAAVLVTDGQGRYLFGKRNDNGKYTMPAGHLNPGEDPKDGALRELWEETNLRPNDITFMTSHMLPGGNYLHTFSCLGSGSIHSKNDPDQECDKWEWVDCRGGVPSNIWEKLHGPEGDANLIRQVFDLKKSDKVWLEDAGFMDLRKAISTVPAGQPAEHPPIPYAGTDRFKEGDSFNYDHVLPKDLKEKGYKLTVHVPPQKGYNIKEESHNIDAIIHHPKFGAVGRVTGINVNKPDPNDKDMPNMKPGLWFESSNIDSAHRKQGLGTAAYEAVMVHGYHHHGARHVRGDVHSSSADATQRKLAAKHGMEFSSQQLHETRLGGISDGAFGPYNYAMKTELAKKDQEDHDSHNLLSHHDPRERAMAIKLNTVTQHDLATALLDPEFKVWQAAFNHPDAPLEVLAMHTRDAAGEPIWPRHDLLLIDPRCKPQHLAMMHRALQHDAYLPVDQQAGRIHAMSQVPQAIWLRKSAEAHQELASTALPSAEYKFDHNKETTHSSLTNLSNAYKTHVSGGSEQGSMPAPGSDLDMGGSESKAIYSVPHGEGITKVMVKPYHDRIAPQAGWAEGTSQHLYRAADLGHLHQESFVGTHGEGKYKVPSTVIKIENAKPMSRTSKAEMTSQTGEDARKIAVMDYVTGNADRHGHNLMMRPNGQLLAIDHGSAFDLNLEDDSSIGYNNDHAAYSDHVGKGVDAAMGGTYDQHLQTIKQWWPQVSDKVKAAFEERLPAVKDAKDLAYLREGFARRTDFLDSLTKTNQNRYWEEQPLPK